MKNCKFLKQDEIQTINAISILAQEYPGAGKRFLLSLSHGSQLIYTGICIIKACILALPAPLTW